MDTKICALIRQTWYETAKKNLQSADRLRFYEMCMEYEFYGNEPDADAEFSARLLFDMVRSDIDADKEKARLRADRSRSNGAKGGRPKLTTINSSDNNPVGFSETQKTSNDNNNNQYTTLHNNECQHDTEDSHMLFNVALLFFEKGCSDPCKEANVFWNYYESLGWKTKGGGEIVDRLALAKAWRLSDCSKVAMRNRTDFAKALHLANPTELILIEEFVSMVKDAASESVVITFQTEASAYTFDMNYLKKIAARWLPVRADGSYYNVSYTILQKSL